LSINALIVPSDKKQHWEKIYESKQPDQVSWTQTFPEKSLKLIDELGLHKSAPIIDIGGGDSNFVDHLIDRGFENISVLDISEKALERVKKRLGQAAIKVEWIISDINEFRPTKSYELWHDRAVFHFLTEPKDIQNYIRLAQKYVSHHIILATFSKQGPTKCSGLNITQYDHLKMANTFAPVFKETDHYYSDHITPFGTTQNFLFSQFIKAGSPTD